MVLWHAPKGALVLTPAPATTLPDMVKELHRCDVSRAVGWGDGLGTLGGLVQSQRFLAGEEGVRRVGRNDKA